MKNFSDYRSAIMLLVVMFFYIWMTHSFPLGQDDNKVGFYKCMDKIIKEGPYHLEGEGVLLLENRNIRTIDPALTVHFGIEGHIDFKRKDHEIRMLLRDGFGYEEVAIGSYRGLGDTHQIFSEIGIKETVDMRPFFSQPFSNEVTIEQLYQSIQKDIEVNRSWVKDTQKGYNPIKKEVITYKMDLGLVLTQLMLEELSLSFLDSFMIEEAQLRYHTDQYGYPIALDLDMRTEQVAFEVSINIKKAI